MTPVYGAGPDAARPPGLARALLRLALDAASWEIVAGDLEEEFHQTRRQAGRAAARRQYWRLTLTSIAGCWRAPTAARQAERRRKEGFRMAPLLQDLKYGARQMRRTPALTTAAVVTLAVGIAAVATVYGLLDALMLRPLAYAAPDRVAFVLGRDVSTDALLFNMRYADVAEIETAGIFDEMAVYRAFDANLTGSGLPERAQAYRVSPNLFGLLGVEAEVGRTFGPADAATAGGRVAVLSHGLWRRRFAADPGTVGRVVELNGEAHTVIGVMPAAFEFPVFNFKGDLWVPLIATPDWTPGDRGRSPSVVAIARLAAGVTVASSQAGADAVMARLATAFPETNGRRGALVAPMSSFGTEQTGPVFALLAVAGVLVLLVSCVNVANLLLARATARGHEFGVRVAMGAGRRRLVRQLLVESLMLAGAAAFVAIVLTAWALDALRGAVPDFIVRVLPGVGAIRADPGVFGVAGGVALLTVLVFGLLPAWQASAPGASTALRAGARQTASRRRRWVRHGLVVAEVAMSVAILAATVMLGRSAINLAHADPGFDKARVLAMSLSAPQLDSASSADVLATFDRMTARLEAVPGVEAIGLIQALPFSTSDASVPFEVVGVAAPDGPAPVAAYRLVTPGYFDAMGLRLLDGRTLDARDGRDGRLSAVVNRRFVERHLGSAPGVGRQIRLDLDTSGGRPLEVVGVVDDLRHSSLAEPPVAEVYVPFALAPRGTMTMAIRTAGDPASLIPGVRAALAEVDARVAPYDVAPMDVLVGNSYLAQSVAAGLMRVFGVGALLLAAVGLYGVLSFAVGQRTREIGVRVALGATRRDVTRLVVRQSVGLVVAGLVLGLALATLGGRAMSSLLFGLGPLDPWSHGLTVLVLLSVAAAASWGPARRALGVDPVVALRAD